MGRDTNDLLGWGPFEPLTNLQDSVIVTTSQLDEPGPTIVYVNEAFSPMFGYTVDEVLGKSPRMFQGPDTDREVLDRIRANLTEGRSFRGETYNYRKNGERFLMRWTIAGIRDAKGEISHYIATQRDMSLQEQLMLRLMERSAIVREFVESRVAQTSEQPPKKNPQDLIERIPGASELTPRERQVLQQLLKGASTKDAAEALELSPYTVRNHTSAIFRKLDVHSTRELVARIMGMGGN